MASSGNSPAYTSTSGLITFEIPLSNLCPAVAMKHHFLLLTLFSTTLCFGQTYYYRSTGETIEGFVSRLENRSVLAHPVIETDAWDPAFKSIIYFLPARTSEGPGIIGYLLVPQKSMLTYRRVLIDTFFNEGGEPHIENVLFENTDNDKERELIIMTSWLQDHRNAGLDGTLYGTFIFDNPSTTEEEYQLRFFKELSEKLDGGFEGKRGKEKVKAEYKKAADIRGELRRLGF